MPDTFQWYAGRIGGLNLKRSTLTLARPFIKAFIPSGEVLDALQVLSERVKNLRAVLSNPDISSYRPVVNPERMVIKEALRAETYLALFGYPIDAVICNRVIPAGNYTDEFMQDLYRNQEALRLKIHQTFAPLPIWEAPYYAREILGIAQLGKLAQTIFGDADPTQVYYRGPIQEVTREGDTYVLRLPLPHVEMDKVLMTKKGDEMIIVIMLVYVRSSQGDQRIIRVTKQMLLPLLSAIVITLGFIFNSQGQLMCTQGVGGSLRYVAILGAVLIVLIGVVRYALSQNRDRRFITQAVLLAIVFVLAILIIELLSGCME